MFAKRPMRSSVPVCPRPALGEPTTMSVWPVQRWSSAEKTPRSSMNGVASSARAVSSIRARNSGAISKVIVSPRYELNSGRG